MEGVAIDTATFTPARHDGAALRQGATVWVVGSAANETNLELVQQWLLRGLAAVRAAPDDAVRRLRPGDVAIGRLDVLPSLDAVEPGLLSLLRLERRGVRTLNRAAALVAVHDKLRTARLLHAAGIPHPQTEIVWHERDPAGREPPFVLKPRLGSWGRDVMLCADRDGVALACETLRARPWFRRRGVLVQELVPPRGHDLRLIVAGGELIGAAERVARPGEWRTNISLGGSLRPVAVPPGAASLALRAASVVGADLVGVDLLPSAGGFVVLELNGAVDFDEGYSLGGRDVYLEAARALGLLAPVVGGVSTGRAVEEVR